MALARAPDRRRAELGLRNKPRRVERRLACPTWCLSGADLACAGAAQATRRRVAGFPWTPTNQRPCPIRRNRIHRRPAAQDTSHLTRETSTPLKKSPSPHWENAGNLRPRQRCPTPRLMGNRLSPDRAGSISARRQQMRAFRLPDTNYRSKLPAHSLAGLHRRSRLANSRVDDRVSTTRTNARLPGTRHACRNLPAAGTAAELHGSSSPETGAPAARPAFTTVVDEVCDSTHDHLGCATNRHSRPTTQGTPW